MNCSPSSSAATPPVSTTAVVVPLAALLAEAPGDRLVVDHLADRFYGGDPLALLDAWLTLLFDWQTTLFGYGIALESHQQNISLRPRPANRRPHSAAAVAEGQRRAAYQLHAAAGAVGRGIA